MCFLVATSVYVGCDQFVCLSMDVRVPTELLVSCFVVDSVVQFGRFLCFLFANSVYVGCDQCVCLSMDVPVPTELMVSCFVVDCVV